MISIIFYHAVKLFDAEIFGSENIIDAKSWGYVGIGTAYAEAGVQEGNF